MDITGYSSEEDCKNVTLSWLYDSFKTLEQMVMCLLKTAFGLLGSLHI